MVSMADTAAEHPTEHLSEVPAEQSTEQSAQQHVEVDDVGITNLSNDRIRVTIDTWLRLILALAGHQRRQRLRHWQ